MKTLSQQSRPHKAYRSTCHRRRGTTTAVNLGRPLRYYRKSYKIHNLLSMSTASKKRKLADMATKYYAVRAGHKPGVYMSWQDCLVNITGFKGAQCRVPLHVLRNLNVSFTNLFVEL